MITFLQYLGLAILPAFILLDLVWQARRYETDRFWRLRATVVSTLAVLFSIGITIFWGKVFAGYSLFDGNHLGMVGGAAVGILIYELVHYAYHRLAHAWDPLWHAAHQMHHSAEKLDAFGAHYLHPLDVFMFTSWSSLVFFPLLGLSPESGALAATFLAFNAVIQHANIKTPHWLGYLIQRPESHVIHHARGYHRKNYADLPLWDMVFGTFENPRRVDQYQLGFYNGASKRIPEMLIGRDVSTPPAVPNPAATQLSRKAAAA